MMTEQEKSDNILDRICIALPCSMNWEDMQGNDEVRLCGGCDKNVYNISAMSKKRAEEILSAPTLPCLQLQRRDDGTLVTDECPDFFKPIRTYWKRTAGFFLSLIALLAPQIAAAEYKLRQSYQKGRPAIVEKPMSKTPLTKVLRKSKYENSLGRPCAIKPNLQHGTKEWREGFTRQHWLAPFYMFGFDTPDVPYLYGDQLKQLAKIAPASVTIEQPAKSDKVTPVYTDAWNKLELAREFHMRACMHFLRREKKDCVRNCHTSVRYYTEAYANLLSVPNYDKEFQRFIRNEKESVISLRSEAMKPLVVKPMNLLSPNNTESSD